MKWARLLIAASTLSGCATARIPQPENLSEFLDREQGVPAGAAYQSANADLNGDGRAETLVYLSHDFFCGSGGCNLLILARQGSGYQIITRTTVTWPPIRLLESKSNGWHDIAVTVAGGGIIPGHEVALHFDGRAYPTNPTPLNPIDTTDHPGKVLIAAP